MKQALPTSAYAESEAFLPSDNLPELLAGAESVLAETGKLASLKVAGEPFPALLALVLYGGWITLEGEGLECSRGALLAACDRVLDCQEWQPSAAFPFTKAELIAGFDLGVCADLDAALGTQ
jgi:hypothetical protein